MQLGGRVALAATNSGLTWSGFVRVTQRLVSPSSPLITLRTVSSPLIKRTHICIPTFTMLPDTLNNSSTNLTHLDPPSYATLLGMDEDDISVPDSPSSESGTLSPDALERQRASLQSYLNALPYECEEPDEMQAKLEHIVGRISVCAETKNWLVLTTWDGMLQWCAYCLSMSPPARLSA